MPSFEADPNSLAGVLKLPFMYDFCTLSIVATKSDIFLKTDVSLPDFVS